MLKIVRIPGQTFFSRCSWCFRCEATFFFRLFISQKRVNCTRSRPKPRFLKIRWSDLYPDTHGVHAAVPEKYAGLRRNVALRMVFQYRAELTRSTNRLSFRALMQTAECRALGLHKKQLSKAFETLSTQYSEAFLDTDVITPPKRGKTEQSGRFPSTSVVPRGKGVNLC